MTPAPRRRVRFKQHTPRSTRGGSRRLQRTLVAAVLAVGLGIPGVMLVREGTREVVADRLATRPNPGPAARQSAHQALLTLPAATTLAASPRDLGELPAGVGRGRFAVETATPVRHPWEDVFASLNAPPVPPTVEPLVAAVPVSHPGTDRVQEVLLFTPAAFPITATPRFDSVPISVPQLTASPALAPSSSVESAPAARVTTAASAIPPGDPGPRSRTVLSSAASLPMVNAAGQDLTVDQSQGNSPFTVSADDTFRRVTVGSPGVGVLSQGGGTFTTDDSLTVGHNGGTGTYNMTDGTLRATTVEIGGVPSTGPGGFPNADSRASMGTFNQSGGTVTVAGNLIVGSGGDLFNAALGGVGTYQLGGSGNVVAAAIEVGFLGSGTFTQGAGTSVTASEGIYLAREFGSRGTYHLDGGTLTTGRVYQFGVGTAVFNFNGGTLRPSASDTVGTPGG